MATPEDTAASFDALNETLRQVTESMAAIAGAMAQNVELSQKERAERQKAIDQAKADDSVKKTNELLKEYGVTLKAVTDGDKKRVDAVKHQIDEEKAARNQLLKTLEEEGVLRKDATEAEKEELITKLELNKLELKRKKAYEDSVKQMGYMFDQNGKIVKQTKLLTDEQEKEITTLKKKNAKEEENRQILENIGNSFTKLATDFGKLGLTAAFDFLKASIIGTYKAQVAYEDALIAGERGRSVEAAAINAKMLEMAGAMDSLGGGLVTLGAETVATGLKMALAGGPIGLLVIAVGSLLAVFGYAAKVEAENMKRTAELKKKQAELFDTLFKDFGALGDASMTGARGMMGLKDDLAAVGLSIKEFEKLNKVLTANSKEIAMFGASTVNGAKSFIEVTGGLINSELSRTFETMGITQEAQIAHAEKYMAMEARFGTLQKKTIDEQVKAAGQYVVELDKMAALTGATRKEQEQAREAVMAIAQLRAALFEAKEKAKTGDPEAMAKVAELERAVKVSTTLMNAGQKDLAMGVAQYSASGGPNTEAAARAMQVLPQVLESIKSGKGTDVTRTQEISSDLKKFLGQYAGTMKYTGAIAGLYQDSLGEADDFITRMEGMEKAKREFESKPENKGKEFDPDKYLEEVRKNKDKETNTQVDIERANREKALAIQEKILNGQELASQEMTNASNTFMDGVIKFMQAVLEFAKHPIDSVKEFFTGKDKSQRDSENLKEKQKELKDTEERIRSLKESTANPEKAKKLADENLALAEKEFKLKEEAVNDLNKKMNLEKDLKKRELLAIQGSALYLEEKAAREKLKLAEQAVDDNKTGLFSKSIDAKKQELAALERKKENLSAEKAALEQQVKTNPPSQTQASFDKTYGKTPGTPQTENDIAAARNKRQGAPTQASDASREAPKLAEGGIVPGTSTGTTVTVGETGKPEAIIPLNMLGENPKSKSSAGSMQQFMAMNDINKDLFDINDKTFELSVKQFDLAKTGSNLTELSNKLTEKQNSIIDDKLIKSMNAETETNNKLIISMNKVTEMLPNTVQKIIDAAPSITGAPGGGATAPAGGGASPAGGSSGKPGESAMSKAGAFSEVQTGPSVNTGKEIHTGGTVSWRTNNPGNVSYGDLAKQYGAIGTWKNPDGDAQQRSTGIAIMPSLEAGDKLKMGLWKRPMYIDKTIDQGVAQWTGTTGLGSAYAKDLASAAGVTMDTKIRELSESQLLAMVTKQRQWEGFKTGKVEPVQAFDGGVFEPRPGGVHVNLAEAGLREAVVPLNPGEKIKIEKSEQAATSSKDPLSTVLATDNRAATSNTDQAAQILSALHDLMEEKFNTMISTLRDGNDITDKLLKYSQV